MPSGTSDVEGLCGNNNNQESDEYGVEGNAHDFGNSQTVKPQCSQNTIITEACTVS